MRTLEQVAPAVATQTKAAAEAELSLLEEKGTEWARQLASVDDDGLTIELEEGDPESVSALIAAHVDRSMEGLRARAEHLDEIQITLFGRTGTGKSSFIEALTRGSGTSVSPDGRLDYTREATVAKWSGVKVIDTPGIEGWSESGLRERIEQDAHEAVQRADVVVLAFDTYNQKVGEFRQIAEWVSRLGKAAIALLNVRDDGWRYDARLSRPEDREAAVQQVREHARHTQRMLDAVGLPAVPILAVNLAWAFGARAKSVKRHPAARDLMMARKDLGVERLLEVSNFHVLLDFLVAVLGQDPEGLRLGTLRHEQDAALQNLVSDLSIEQQGAALRADQIERAIKTVLSRTGVPTRVELEEVTPRARERIDGFLHSLRGTSLRRPRPRKGQVTSILDDHLRAPLTRAHSLGLKAAQDLLRRKAGKRASVTPKELEKTALKVASFKAAADPAIKAAYRDLAEQIQADAEDLRADFRWEIEDLEASFDANAGAAKRWGGRAGGVGISVAVAAFVVSNPGGWAIAGAVVVGAVGNWLMRRLRKSGDDDRVKARLRAEREVAQWLDASTEAVRGHARGLFAQAAWDLAAQTQSAAATTAVVERRLEQAIDAVLKDIADMQAGLSGSAIASEIVKSAKQSVEEARFGNDTDAARKAWLGEDWLDSEQDGRRVRAEPLVRPPLGGEIEIPVPAQEQLEAFWVSAERAAAARPRLRDAVEQGRRVLTERPVVVFAGDYSAGKSSLIRRMAATMGFELKPDERRFPIGGDPTTTEIATLPGADIALCDTPGLSSEEPEHGKLAKEAAAGASVIVMTHTPVAGKLDSVREFLVPDGRAIRAHRALHTLVQIDALSARPSTHPEGFEQLLAAKRAELRERLLKLRLQLHADAPLPVAADPGGRHAGVARWDPADFELSRTWDGIDDLIAVIQRIARYGGQLAAVDRTITSLDHVRAGIAAEAKAGGLREREHRRIGQLLERAVQRHKRLEARAAADLQAVVQSAISERLDELAEMSPGQLAKARESPEDWLVTEELEADFEAWRERTAKSAEEIYAELEKSLEARIHSKAFGRAFRADGRDSIADSVLGGLKDLLGSATGAGKERVAATAQQWIARIPALAPFAEQLGQAAARGVAVAAGVLLEVVFQGMEEGRQKKRERELEAARTAITKAGDSWVKSTLNGTKARPGVLDELLKLKREHLERPLKRVRARLAKERSSLDGLQEADGAALVLIGEGCNVLS